MCTVYAWKNFRGGFFQRLAAHGTFTIFRAFLLIIGHKMNVCMIALDKSGINMKCSDGLKPLCAVEGIFPSSLEKMLRYSILITFDGH